MTAGTQAARPVGDPCGYAAYLGEAAVQWEVDVADPGERLLDDMSEDQLIERVMQRRAVAQRKLS